jgi:predicted DNA-binding transcriptional regulator YafY
MVWNASLPVLDTSARLLRLLSLLQSRRAWTGPELAERLGVAPRTIRRDMERLRSLGYPVNAAPGAAGGYRLGAGAALPPLLLDDEEAVAVAVCLRTAANGTVSGIEESSMRALAKLEQVLPSRLRRRVHALGSFTVPTPAPAPAVEPEVLAELAAACRDRERLRFGYRSFDGGTGRRTVEPHRLVQLGRRWYLVAWDTDRAGWRSFRVDRITTALSPGTRFPARRPPPGGAAAFVAKGALDARNRWRARVVLHAPRAEVSARVPLTVGTLEAIDDETCELHTGADWLGSLAIYSAAIGVDFEVIEPPELIDELRSLADRFRRATGGP